MAMQSINLQIEPAAVGQLDVIVDAIEQESGKRKTRNDAIRDAVDQYIDRWMARQKRKREQEQAAPGREAPT